MTTRQVPVYSKDMIKLIDKHWEDFGDLASRSIDQVAEDHAYAQQIYVERELNRYGDRIGAWHRTEGRTRGAVDNAFRVARDRLTLDPAWTPDPAEEPVRLALKVYRTTLRDLVIAVACQPGQTGFVSATGGLAHYTDPDQASPYDAEQVKAALTVCADALAHFWRAHVVWAAAQPEYSGLLTPPVEMRERPA